MQITQEMYMDLVKALAEIRNATDHEMQDGDEKSMYTALHKVNAIARKALDEDMKRLVS